MKDAENTYVNTWDADGTSHDDDRQARWKQQRGTHKDASHLGAQLEITLTGCRQGLPFAWQKKEWRAGDPPALLPRPQKDCPALTPQLASDRRHIMYHWRGDAGWCQGEITAHHGDGEYETHYAADGPADDPDAYVRHDLDPTKYSTSVRPPKLSWYLIEKGHEHCYLVAGVQQHANALSANAKIGWEFSQDNL